MPYKIYLINLARSTDRLEAMRSKLTELHLPFERIEATDGKAMTVEARAAFAQARPRPGGWSPGAIGCFMSHHAAWTAIAADTKDFGVVFEDDVHIGASLPAMLAELDDKLEGIDIVRLEATKHRVLLDHSNTVLLGACKLVQVRSETWGSGAYVIPRRAAQQLLDERTTTHNPVDFFLFDKTTSSVAQRHRVYQTVPALCVQSKFDVSLGKPETSYASVIEHNAGDTPVRLLLRKIGWKVNGLLKLMRGYRRIRLSDDIVRL